MHTLILLAALSGYVSIPPIRIFQPFPNVKCPAGYSLWWPEGKEFSNDQYAECIKSTRAQPKKIVSNVSLRRKIRPK